MQDNAILFYLEALKKKQLVFQDLSYVLKFKQDIVFLLYQRKD